MPVPLILPDIPAAVEVSEARVDSDVAEVVHSAEHRYEPTPETAAASLLTVEPASRVQQVPVQTLVLPAAGAMTVVGVDHLPDLAGSAQAEPATEEVAVWNDGKAAIPAPETLELPPINGGSLNLPPSLPLPIGQETPGALPSVSNAGTLDGEWQDGAVVPASLAQEEISPVLEADGLPAANLENGSAESELPEVEPVQGDEDPAVVEADEDPAAAADDGAEEPMAPPPVILRADRQTYDPLQQTVRAVGDVLVQFGDAQIAAERLWVNLENRYVRAEGNVFFNRNEQIIEGESATYNLLQGSGTMDEARGELLLPSLEQDLSLGFSTDQDLTNVPLDYRLQQEGSISQVTSPGGLAITTDAQQALFGTESDNIRRIRFETGGISFDADGWYAEEVRLTNDPFSPPEIELRGDTVRLTPLNEEEDELYIENPRLVFDQGLSIPLLKNRYILRRGQFATDELNPLPTSIGIDGRDRDGLFVERELQIATGGPWQFRIAPQFYIGRWLGNSDFNIADPANFGFVARLNGPLGPRTSAIGVMSLPGLDLENFTERLRASLRAQHLIGDHRLNLEYSYRDRLFNGSLGFQDVQSSLGALLESPNIVLGDSKINLRYQLSGQYVTANTDQRDLLPPGSGRQGLVSLFRFQGAVDFSRGFTLWRGQPLPSTPTEGLRYSPRPIVPFLALGAGLRGVATYYTSDDLQETLEARVALSGQLGHLRRNYFDYTQFNIGYSTSVVAGDPSPFLFDRVADRNVLSGGIVQQIYGPLLAGFQTSFNVDTGREINTELIVEYRRRAYGLLFRYSPIQDTGFIGFRLSDFNWTGRTRPFDSEPTSEEEVIVQ